jgi:hypothetical protein
MNGETFTEFFCETCGTAGSSPPGRPVKSCTPVPQARMSSRNMMFAGDSTTSTAASSSLASGSSNGLENFPADCSSGFCWRRACNSNTGTCFVSETSCPSTGVQVKVPSLQLTWKGDEPLDRLHLVVRVSQALLSQNGIFTDSACCVCVGRNDGIVVLVYNRRTRR